MWALITTLIPLILKNLPLLVGIFSGLSKTFSKVDKLPVDPEEIAKLVEEITEQEIVKIMNSNRERLEKFAEERVKEADMKAWKEINDELDELEKVLEQQAREYQEYLKKKEAKKQENPQLYQ